jgi:hypothetical protein
VPTYLMVRCIALALAVYLKAHGCGMSSVVKEAKDFADWLNGG